MDMRSPRSERRSRVREFQYVAAVVFDGCLARDGGALCEQSHDRARRHGLAGSGFADDGDGLAAMQLERHILHRVDGAVLDLESDRDVAGVDHRLAGLLLAIKALGGNFDLGRGHGRIQRQ